MTRVQVVSIIAAVLVLLVIFSLVRAKKLQENYAILWIISGFSLLIISIFTDILNIVADIVGIYYPPAVLIPTTIGIIVMLSLHFSVVISRLSKENRALSRKIALIERDVAELQDSGRLKSE